MGHVWGLGEREGNLVISNSTRISLFTNNNEMKSYSNDAYTTLYGRNGFYPIYYSQINATTKSLGVINFNEAA